MLDIAAFLSELRGDLLAIADEAGTAPTAQWLQPSPLELEQRIRVHQGAREALSPGRPKVVKDLDSLATVPRSWGLYRIHRVKDDTWYVGISSNLRARLGAHKRNGMFTPGTDDRVEVVLAKRPGVEGVITWADLQAAENRHLRGFKDKGNRVVNVTAGSNGRPPEQRFNALVQRDLENLPPGERRRRRRGGVQTLIWYEIQGEDETKVPGTEHDEVQFGFRWQTLDGDWDLWLHPSGYLSARASGAGAYTRTGRTTPLSADWLRQRYASEYGGASLDEALSDLNGDWRLPDSLTVHFAYPRRRDVDERGREYISPAALEGISESDVRKRTLPSTLERAGYVVDESFQKANSLNAVMRVTAVGHAAVYVKTEENRNAARAEVLVSLLWSRLSWPGLPGRALLDSTGRVLRIPEVGGAGVEDAGPFQIAFRMFPDESTKSLRAAGAANIKRLSLEDLRLWDEKSVVQFVTVNAITGNTDRHRGNLHYGVMTTRPAGMPAGCLLPLDHGRCVFNNIPDAKPDIQGSPSEAVTGQLGNPHQLLRPFTQYITRDRDAARDIVSTLLVRLGIIMQVLVVDPAWHDYTDELRCLEERTILLAADIDRFFDDCSKVVLP